MTGPVEPTRRIAHTRRQRRRADDPTPHDLPPGESAAAPNLPAVVDQPARDERRAAPGPAPDPGFSIFAAQIIGQEHRRRGLKGGQPVLDEARSSYLGAEFSGSADRRPRVGRITKTEI